MITRSQTQQRSSTDENQCPNNIFPDKNSLRSPSLKPFSSTFNNEGASTAQKTQIQQQWPSVKQLREHYETLPGTSNGSSKDVVVGGRQRRNSSSSSSSAYRRQRGSRNNTSRSEQQYDVALGSKHEIGLKLRRENDQDAAATSLAKYSNECSTKEEVDAATENNGFKVQMESSWSAETRVKEESEDEKIEPTMVQQTKTNNGSFPTTPSYSDEDTKEATPASTPKDVVSQFEGCRLKSNQTVADAEDNMINGDVMEEEADVMEKERTNCIQLQEDPADETVCSPNFKKEIIPTTSTLKETVLSINLECSTTTSTDARDILLCLSQLALLGLTLFGVHHRYAQAQVTSSQGPTKENGSLMWQQILRVGLVYALFAKAAYKSTQAAVVKESRMQKVVCFIRHLMIWAVTIPFFHKCSFGANNMCFLPTKMASQLGLTSPAGICIPTYSLVDVAATNGYHALLSLLKSVIKSKLLSQVFREIQRALFNPFKFHARVQKALVILKWAKFIGPLIGTCNKFKGNLMDMVRKRRQHRVSKAALKRWYDAIDALSKLSKSEQAVVQLQKAFRERRVEKTKKRQLLMSNRRWVRSKLEEEERLMRTKLEQIERRDIDRQQRRQISVEERRGIAQHRKSARQLMKRLLLNPKNYFSVIWKYLTVSCVALEIMTILFAPVLSGDVKKMPLDQFIVKVLLGSRPQCNKSARNAPSLFVPSIGSIGDITCSGSKTKQVWIVTAHVIATMIVPAVNCICFLDVFITFFTGELSSTGTLQPKPVFQRWVLPGPVLQLIVNPTMSSIKTAVLNALGASIKIGPSLCLHCFLSCGVHAVYLYDIMFDSILDFVEKINEINTKTKGQDDDEHLHWT